jgi:hypothetical protein
MDLDAELSIPVWIGWYDCNRRWRCVTGPLTTNRAVKDKLGSLRLPDATDVSEFRTRDNPRPAWHLIGPSG